MVINSILVVRIIKSISESKGVEIKDSIKKYFVKNMDKKTMSKFL
jgi:hypothetical protein